MKIKYLNIKPLLKERKRLRNVIKKLVVERDMWKARYKELDHYVKREFEDY